MALLWYDSFETYSLNEITLGRYTQVNLAFAGTLQLVSGGGAHGNTALRNYNSAWQAARINITKLFQVTHATWYVGFYFKTQLLTGGPFDICSIADGSTLQCDLCFDTSGKFYVTRNGTTIASESGHSLGENSYVHIQWLTTINSSTGSTILKIDNVEKINATGLNTQNTGNAFADSVRLGGTRLAPDIPTRNWHYSDYYIGNGSGSAPYNTSLGVCRTDVLRPTSDVTLDFTPNSGSTGYTQVDESNPDNDTTYITSSTLNHLALFEYENLNLTGNPTIYAVQSCPFIKNPEGGGRSIASYIDSSSSIYTGSNLSLGSSYRYELDICTTDPNTSSAWTQSTVNAAKYGVKITV